MSKIADLWRAEAAELRRARGCTYGLGVPSLRREGFAVFYDESSPAAQSYAAELEAMAEIADGGGDFGS